MKSRIWMFVWLFACINIGCYDEKSVTPSETPEDIYGKYTLPQGDHEYDDAIVDFYKKYGSLILYKFEDKDFWWTPSGDIRWAFYDNGVDRTLGYEADPADEAYVGNQLELLNQTWFKFFADSSLTRLLPQKILMTSRLDFVQNGEGYPVEEDYVPLNCYSGYDYIAVNWGNEKILTMDAEAWKLFKADVCYMLLERATSKIMIGYAAVFASVSNYGLNFQSHETEKMYGNGILDYNHRTDPTRDWMDYLHAIIYHSLEELEGEGGILSAAIDINGKIREKYDIMTDYFKSEYNIDLQAIGDEVKR